MKSHTMYWFIFVSTYIDIIYIDTYIYIYIYLSSLYFVYIHIPLNKITKKRKCRPSSSTSSCSNPSVLHHPNAIRRFEIPEACLGHQWAIPGKTPFGWASCKDTVYTTVYTHCFPHFWGGWFLIRYFKVSHPHFLFWMVS